MLASVPIGRGRRAGRKAFWARFRLDRERLRGGVAKAPAESPVCMGMHGESQATLVETKAPTRCLGSLRNAFCECCLPLDEASHSMQWDLCDGDADDPVLVLWPHGGDECAVLALWPHDDDGVPVLALWPHGDDAADERDLLDDDGRDPLDAPNGSDPLDDDDDEGDVGSDGLGPDD